MGLFAEEIDRRSHVGLAPRGVEQRHIDRHSVVVASSAGAVGHIDLIRSPLDQAVHIPLDADRTRRVADQHPPPGTPFAQQPLGVRQLRGEVRQQIGPFEVAVNVAPHEIVVRGVHQPYAQGGIRFEHVDQPRIAHFPVGRALRPDARAEQDGTRRQEQVSFQHFLRY